MLSETISKELTVGEIVTADFRAAAIFRNAGIDFCCGGKKSLEQVCLEKTLETSMLIEQLKNLEQFEERTYNFNEWSLSFLSDYIVNTHHKYVIKTLPDLVFYTQKIAQVHGANHPELKEAASLIIQVDHELRQHLKNEEEVLFPAIKKLAEFNLQEDRQTINTEITRMIGEHDFAGGTMDYIHTITSGYKLPDDACQTYKVAFRLLEQFEDDLHIHVHLENNILYPKALKL